MDAQEEFRVVFNGIVRNGFDPHAVRRQLANHLKAEIPAGTERKTLLHTRSKEEARQHVLRLAKLGAITQIERAVPAYAGAAANIAPQQKSALTKQHRTLQLHRYAPLSRSAPFTVLLSAAVAFEGLLVLLYGLLMLAILAGTLYFSLFTLWGTLVFPHPLPALVLQVACLPLGLALFLLLLKPVLSLRGDLHHGILLPPDQEPDLYLYVDDICRQLQIAPPQQIRLNNDINARMYHLRGPLGFWHGETVLTLGTPMLAALNSSQLAAHIAHTLLSFRNPRAPRRAFIIMALHHWMHHAVYGEDMLDIALQRWTDHGRLSHGLTAGLRRLFALSHKALALRMQLSRFLERSLVHRIIADADKQALILAGSEGFAHLFEQQRLLEYTADLIGDELQQQWRKRGSLPNDWVKPLLHRVEHYTPAMRQRILQEKEAEKARNGDVIPSHRQRIQRMRAKQLLPAYTCLTPARELLRYFSKLTHTMTLRYYHNRLLLQVTGEHLEFPLLEGTPEQRSAALIETFFQGHWHPFIPLDIGKTLKEYRSISAARVIWKTALKHLAHHEGRIRLCQRSCQEAEKTLLENSLREALYRTELWQRIGEERLAPQALEAFYQQCRDHETTSEELQQKMRHALRPYVKRMTAILTLLQHAAEENSLALRYYNEAEELISLHDRIDSITPLLREMRLHTSLLQALLSHRSRRTPQALQDRIQQEAADTRQLLTSLRVALMGLPNVFSSDCEETLMEYLLKEAYTEESPEGDLDRGNDVLQRLSLFQRLLLGRLIAIVQQVEKSLIS